MNSEHQPPRSLREIELAVEAEGREWTRQRLQEELQRKPTFMAAFFPHSHRLRHGKHVKVLKEIESLIAPKGDAGKVIKRE